MYKLNRQFLLTLLMPLALTLSIGVCESAWAAFEPPPRRPVPFGTAGGGSRPIRQACLQSPDQAESLVAFSPQPFIGLSGSAQPTFWVYVPPTTTKTLEFSLFDEQQNGLYQTTIDVTESGYVKLTLPPTVTLAPQQRYYWTAALACNAARRTEDWVVGGWVKYQPLDVTLQRSLNTASTLQQVALYAESGFWYDAFNTLVTLRQAQLDDATLGTAWAKLMQMAGLESMAAQSNLPLEH